MNVMIKPTADSLPYIATTEAAPGIAQIDVTAVASKQARAGYAARQKIYPKLAHGTFRRVKWAVMAVTLGIYYLLPWIRWDRGESLPDQAFLLDFANQRLFFGPIEIWAQELYYITGLLILSALGLFLVTSVAGRMWCGYTCPQTVWTDLMIVVERVWQGDRNARIRLDAGPWNFEKVWKKAGTHVSWLLVALATGGAFVFYFSDAPTLARELVSGEAPAIAYLFLGIFTVTTYLLGGIAREQVCIYMCPWPRIQGAMFDTDSLLISYRGYRGEPRGPHKKGQTWEGRGDCIDCKACVAVCPTGIDIRDGAQLECIQCALCIDACDEIMDRIERPRGLVAYDTFKNLDVSHQERAPLRLVRPRTILYAAVMALVAAIMLWAWLHRTTMEISVLRPPAALRAAHRRVPAQRLHRQAAEQAAREAHLPALAKRSRARQAVDRRPRGRGAEDRRRHRQPARAQGPRHGAERRARGSHRRCDALPVRGDGRGRRQPDVPRRGVHGSQLSGAGS